MIGNDYRPIKLVAIGGPIDATIIEYGGPVRMIELRRLMLGRGADVAHSTFAEPVAIAVERQAYRELPVRRGSDKFTTYVYVHESLTDDAALAIVNERGYA